MKFYFLYIVLLKLIHWRNIISWNSASDRKTSPSVGRKYIIPAHWPKTAGALSAASLSFATILTDPSKNIVSVQMKEYRSSVTLSYKVTTTIRICCLGTWGAREEREARNSSFYQYQEVDAIGIHARPALMTQGIPISRLGVPIDHFCMLEHPIWNLVSTGYWDSLNEELQNCQRKEA